MPHATTGTCFSGTDYNAPADCSGIDIGCRKIHIFGYDFSVIYM